MLQETLESQIKPTLSPNGQIRYEIKWNGQLYTSARREGLSGRVLADQYPHVTPRQTDQLSQYRWRYLIVA
jgi:hypothetical protein